MKIEGFLGTTGHAYITAVLRCRKLGIEEPIAFLVDMGATTTTLLEGDVERLGIDVSKLTRSTLPVTVCGGLIYPYTLPSVELLLLTTQQTIVTEKLKSIDVCDPSQSRDRPPFSLLGIDILKRYRVVYDRGKQIALEK